MTKINTAFIEKSTPRYKDNVLRKLLEDEVRAREVVSAITGIDYDADTPIIVHDLGTSLHHRFNDVAVSIDDKLLVMIEHQSTFNPNMPFRLLEYVVAILESAFVEAKQLYSKKLHKFPTPIFYVLYNGVEPLKVTELKLSDAFKTASPPNGLELVAEIIDVNFGGDHPVLAKSESLQGYAILIEKIREFQRNGQNRDKAIASAMDFCIINGVLTNFLQENYAEVMRLMLREYNQEEEHEVIRQDAFEQKTFEIAQKMLQLELTISDIIEATGLSECEINKLR